MGITKIFFHHFVCIFIRWTIYFFSSNMPWNIPNLWLSPSLARCNCWLNIGHNYGNIYLPSVLSVCHRRILWNSTESPNHQKTNFNNSFHSTFQQTWLKLSKSGCDRWRCREFKRFDGFLEFQWFGITFFTNSCLRKVLIEGMACQLPSS